MFLSSGKIRFYLIVIAVNFMNLMLGMMLTWASPVLPKLVSNSTLDSNPLGRIITTNEQSWIAALISVGGIIGPSLGGFIMEAFGRKIAIAAVHIPNIIGTLCAAFGNNIWYFYVARIAAGISINAALGVGAIYFGEIGESQVRGILYSTTSISINLGTLLSYCIGPYTSIRDFNLILCGIALTGIILTLLLVPESPYYLILNNKIEKAENSLSILRNTNDINEEIKDIQEDISKIQNDGVFAIFKTQATRRTFFISVILTSLQQFSGINVIYSYTQLIFDQAGSNLSSDVSSILVGVAQFVTIYLTPLGVERFGRKKLLTFASTGLVFTLALLGTFFHFQDNSSVDTSKINWIPLFCLILFFTFFNCGLGGLPFLYMSEILPHNVKSASSSVILAIYCTVGFIITYFFNALVDLIGNSGSFYVFAVAMAVYAIYVSIFLFETQGKTLQEIGAHFSKSKQSKDVFKA